MKDSDIEIILFDSTEQRTWLKCLTEVYDQYSEGVTTSKAVLEFADSILVEDIRPFHLVTMACLIHYLDNIGKLVAISNSNQRVFDYIYNELGFYEYWSGGKNHVEAKSSLKVFNLWRIVENEKDVYAKNVENYFRQIYFHDKDLSAVSVSLVEAYYNVFDHAKANGNAFSIIQYDETNGRLIVAISDFGIGIAKSVRDFDGDICNDCDAILKAIEDNFTVGSTERNKGLGLGNILAPTDEALLVSHRGWVERKGLSSQTEECDFWFPGTLICFEMDLMGMENEEFIEEFII